MDAHDSEGSSAPSDASELDPEAVRNAIRARGEEIKRQELEQAFNQLESQGTLTDRRRQIIRHLATAIVDGVLQPPESALSDTPDHDPETVRTAVELFDPDR